jgi:hypothetical protein
MSFQPPDGYRSPEEVGAGDDDDGGAVPFDPGGDPQQSEGGETNDDDGDDLSDGAQRPGPAPDPGDGAQTDPDTSDPDPAPTEGEQAAEGADDPDAGGDDSLDPIERSEGRDDPDADTSPDEPADPTPDTPSGPGSEFGPPGETTPEEGDTTQPGGAQPGETAPGEAPGEARDIGDEVDREPTPPPEFEPRRSFEPGFADDAEPVPDFATDTAADVREDVAAGLAGIGPSQIEVRYLPDENQVVGRPSGEAYEGLIDRIEQERQEELAEDLSRGPGPEVEPWQIDTEVVGEGQDVQVIASAPSDVLGDLYRASPGAAGPTDPSVRATDVFTGAPGAAAPTGDEIERGQDQVEDVEQRVADQLRDDIDAPGFEVGDEIAIEREDGEVTAQLTPQGRRFYFRNVAAREGELAGRRVTDLDQIEFGPRGYVENVDEPPINPGGRGGESGGLVEDLVFSGPLGFAAAQPEEAAALLEGVRDTSQEAADRVQTTLFEPVAEGFGDFYSARPGGIASGEYDADEADALSDLYAYRPGGVASGELEDVEGDEIDTPAGQAAAGVGRGALDVTVGAPGNLVTIGATAGAGGAFAVENPNVAAPAAAAFGTTLAAQTAESAATQPYRFGGALVGSSITATALSPIRFSRLDVPRTEGSGPIRPTRPSVDVDADVRRMEGAEDVEAGGGPPVRVDADVDAEGPGLARSDTSTLRGIRLRDPVAVERLRGQQDAGTTLVGFRGFRPTLGAPRVDVGTVRFGDLDGMGQTFEPISGFESGVFRRSVADEGGQAAARFRARRQLMRIGRQTEGDLNVESTEELVSSARAVPEDAAGDVARALEELDATVEGSAATAAQVEGFRQPRDLDILVRDKPEARQRLSEALSESNAEVSEVFDVKEAGEGRPGVGEPIKGGMTARWRLRLEGEAGSIGVTQAGEELVRKSSASAFLRGPGSPSAEFEGRTGEFDVGPEPVTEGGRVRYKDPADAYEIARRVDPENPAVQRFGELFEPEITRADRGADTIEPLDLDAGRTGVLDDLGDTLRLDDLAADEAAQVQLGLRRADVDATDARRAGRDDVDARRRQDTDADAERRERSPGRRGDESPSPATAGASTGTVPGVGGLSPLLSGDRDVGSAAGGGASPETAFGGGASPLLEAVAGDSPAAGASPDASAVGIGSPGRFGSRGGPGSPGSTASLGGGGGGGGGTSGGGGGGGGTPGPDPRGMPPVLPEDPDEPEESPLFGGRRDEVITDFVDPLTGQRQSTEGADPSPEPDEPAFLGFVEDS